MSNRRVLDRAISEYERGIGRELSVEQERAFASGWKAQADRARAVIEAALDYEKSPGIQEHDRLIDAIRLHDEKVNEHE